MNSSVRFLALAVGTLWAGGSFALARSAGAADCTPACPAGFSCTGYGECTKIPPEAPIDLSAPVRSITLEDSFHTRLFGNLRESVNAIVIHGVFPTKNVTFEPEVPLLYEDRLARTKTGTAGDGTLLAGNPTFVAQGHWFVSGAHLHAGAGVALPLVTVEDEHAQNTAALLLAAGTQGLWNVWWYSADTATAFVPFGARYVTPFGLDVRVEGAAGLLFSVAQYMDHYGRGVLQGGLYAGYATSAFEAGVRLRGAFVSGLPSIDDFQSSVEPVVRVGFGSFVVGAGALFNIDGPFGPWFTPESVWGARVEVGVRF